jgi:hypothetical protein
MNKEQVLLIVRNYDNTPSIQKFPSGSRPRNFVAYAPNMMKIGDEEFLSFNFKNRLVIDWAGLDSKYKIKEKAAKLFDKENWNESSPLKRIWNAYSSD